MLYVGKAHIGHGPEKFGFGTSVASARMPSGEAETPRPQGSEEARRKLSNPARTESPAEIFDDPGFTPKARPTPAAAPILTAPAEQNVTICSQEGDGDISAEVGAVELLDSVLGPQADVSPETAAQKPPTQEGSPPPVSARRVLSLYGEWERDEYVVLNDNQRRAAFLRGGAVPVVGLTQASWASFTPLAITVHDHPHPSPTRVGCLVCSGLAGLGLALTHRPRAFRCSCPCRHSRFNMHTAPRPSVAPSVAPRPMRDRRRAAHFAPPPTPRTQSYLFVPSLVRPCRAARPSITTPNPSTPRPAPPCHQGPLQLSHGTAHLSSPLPISLPRPDAGARLLPADCSIPHGRPARARRRDAQP